MSDFGYCYAYEDRDEVHTSRWLLKGVSTRGTRNLLDGRLWFSATDTNDAVAVNFYNELACGVSSLVATGTADISGIDDAPAKCTIVEANESGLSGECYFESNRKLSRHFSA